MIFLGLGTREPKFELSVDIKTTRAIFKELLQANQPDVSYYYSGVHEDNFVILQKPRNFLGMIKKGKSFMYPKVMLEVKFTQNSLGYVEGRFMHPTHYLVFLGLIVPIMIIFVSGEITDRQDFFIFIFLGLCLVCREFYLIQREFRFLKNFLRSTVQEINDRS